MSPAVAKIVFPVDFSERSDAAARWAAAFARKFDAELVMIHVVEPVQYLLGTLEFGAGALDSFHTELVTESRGRLRSYLREELAQVRLRRVLVEGDPALRIVEFAHQEDAGLIMMPSHGLGPFRRFILGSVTAKVLHDAHIPVWTGVHMENTPAPEHIAIRQVLCAVDLGPHSSPTLKWAASFAAENGAQLTIAHAVPGIEARPARYFDAELSQMLRREARQQIDQLKTEAGVDGQVCLGAGEAAEVVRYAAEQHRADLVVIGRGSAAGIAGSASGRLRTHAYSIIRQSPCPVVSV
jgi:nucleotide-binding universal stress UspA family protein